MSKALARQGGRYQYNAKVACYEPRTGYRRIERVTVFCDDRDDAVREATAAAQEMGYEHPTVDHITKTGDRA